MRHCLISYDIADSGRRTRLAARLEKKGRRIQKSVFVVECLPGAWQHLEQELQKFIDEGDSLLILPICESCLSRALLCADLPVAFFWEE